MRKLVTKLFLLLLIIVGWITPLTNANYYDSESSYGNNFYSACWDAPDTPAFSSPGAYSNSLSVNFVWNQVSNRCPFPTVFYRLIILDETQTLTLYDSDWYMPSESGPMNHIYTFSAQGQYWYKVMVKDEYDTVNDPALNQLTVDTVSPVISNIIHLIASPAESNSLTADVSWETNEVSSCSLRYKYGSGTWSSPTSTLSSNTHSLSFSIFENESYDYEIICEDLANNSTSSANSFEVDAIRFGLPTLSNIVINEYLPNPIGSDSEPMPAGEWIEIYNRGSVTRNLSNWYLTDAYLSHKLFITAENTTSSDPSTSDLNIAPGEFMVVYRNGDLDFDLNNGFLGDTVNLHRPSGIIVDFHVYTGILGDDVIENKSMARYPDGSNSWFDPIPTPLSKNILEESIDLDFFVNPEKTTIGFSVGNISEYEKISYEISYKSDEGVQGIIGQQETKSQSVFERKDIILGTCSSGGSCVYHQNPHDFVITVTLTDKNSKTAVKSKSI